MAEEEKKEGAIQSLQEVAQELSSAIQNGEYKDVQTILDSFEKNSTADATVDLLSEHDFDRLQTLQRKANETITTNEIEEYVLMSDRIATGLLCGARVVDKSLTGICNNISDILEATKKNADDTVDKIKQIVKRGTHMSDEIFQITYNSYNHARWFFQTVLSNSSEEPVFQNSKEHIRNKYGYLLFIYDHNTREFDYNDALTKFLMPLVVKDIESIKGPDRPRTAPSELSEGFLKKKSEQLAPSNIRPGTASGRIETQIETQIETLENQLAIIENDIAFIENDMQNNNQNNKNKRGRDSNDSNEENQPSKKIRSSNEILYFLPRIGLVKGIINERKNKRNESPNGPVNGPATGGKPHRQTRRKIRRNKKAKTKKRKVNKKTKKRKTNKKRKVNRKKSKKRRTKK